MYFKNLYCGGCNVIIFRYLGNSRSIFSLEFGGEVSKSSFLLPNIFLALLFQYEISKKMHLYYYYSIAGVFSVMNNSKLVRLE